MVENDEQLSHGFLHAAGMGLVSFLGLMCRQADDVARLGLRHADDIGRVGIHQCDDVASNLYKVGDSVILNHPDGMKLYRPQNGNLHSLAKESSYGRSIRLHDVPDDEIEIHFGQQGAKITLDIIQRQMDRDNE
ncbi:hypothetical protein [Rubinisphaera italica]|uniref:Uncharacterized protein n=1 Tax=Rubinisphaera italica TaxID=2527969 RepID=A0A5C5XCT6_9PLAN|nr:hypothetical protein [Rubinisphaera italica]TWT60876.1 hypothetical protein Pan54_16060 [Rubinisphaera italica]